jgi:hypothetical protein
MLRFISFRKKSMVLRIIVFLHLERNMAFKLKHNFENWICFSILRWESGHILSYVQHKKLLLIP